MGILNISITKEFLNSSEKSALGSCYGTGTVSGVTVSHSSDKTQSFLHCNLHPGGHQQVYKCMHTKSFQITVNSGKKISQDAD